MQRLAHSSQRTRYRFTLAFAASLCVFALAACGNEHHEGCGGDPGHCDPDPYPCPGYGCIGEDAGWPPGEDASSPQSDAGVPAADSGKTQPDCWSFTTRQGAVCVACEDDGKEIVSCTPGAPTKPLCHDLEVGAFDCIVCHDRAGELLSVTCKDEGTPGRDAGTPAGDAGTPAGDAGAPEPDSGGCSGDGGGGKADLCSCP